MTKCAIYSTLWKDSTLLDKLTKLILKKTSEFSDWYRSIDSVNQTKVDARLESMKDGVFNGSRNLKSGLFEAKWKNGMRVYYSRKRIAGADVIALWGGFKGRQDKDIHKARGIKGRYENAFKTKKDE